MEKRSRKLKQIFFEGEFDTLTNSLFQCNISELLLIYLIQKFSYFGRIPKALS